MKFQQVFETPDDGNYFFGYYDIPELNQRSTRILAQRADFMDRMVRAGDRLEIGYFEFPSGKQFHRFAETTAWNWQQGCQLRWRGGDFGSEVIFNDIREGRFVSVIHDIDSGTERQLPFPVYTVSPNGKWAMCVDYERHYWFRQGYGYVGVENPEKRKPVDLNDGIWLLSLESGECKKVITLDRLRKFGWLSTMNDGPNYFEHLVFNPSGDRFCFLHRWCSSDGGILSRLYTSDREGNDIYILNDSGRMSHFCWRNDEWMFVYGGLRNPFNDLRRSSWATRYLVKPIKPIYQFLVPPTTSIARRVTGYGFLLLKDRTDQVTQIAAAFLNEDGHPSFQPGNEDVFVVDTYPDKNNVCDLKLVNLKSLRLLASQKIRSLEWVKETGYRSDLHPKWSPDGQFVCVDTVEGGHRAIRAYRLVDA